MGMHIIIRGAVTQRQKHIFKDHGFIQSACERIINWDGGELADIERVANRIKTSVYWKRELIELGDIGTKSGGFRWADYEGSGMVGVSLFSGCDCRNAEARLAESFPFPDEDSCKTDH